MHSQNLLAKIYNRVQPKQRSCLYYWAPTRGANFGDDLSWHITQRLIEYLGGDASQLRACEANRRYEQRVFALGSILHFCKKGDVVWGSGVNGKVPVSRYNFAGVEFRAVRGPLTRRMVTKNYGTCPAVYGDPGLLVPTLFPELVSLQPDRPRFSVSLVPNLNDQVLLNDDEQVECHVISPQEDWKTVLQDIAASDFVVSSSLHGIILADVLGIPCRPLLSLFESPLKYQDYLLSTNRSDVRFATSLDEALKLGAIAKPEIDLSSLIGPLFDAFPIEIFSP